MTWLTNLEVFDRSLEEAKADGIYGVIYRARCRDTGKVYVGQTIKKLSERFYQHQNKNSCTHFYNAIEKYGTESFEITIIDFCKSKEHLDNREKFWIAFYGFGTPYNMTYNLKSGGEGGEFSEATRQRLSEAWDDRKVAVDVYRIVEKGKPCTYIFTCESIKEVVRRLRDNYGVEISVGNISNILQGLQLSYKGFIFTKADSPAPIYDPMETSLKITRLDKDTMEVLEIYESGIQAASWLVEHGYTNTKFISGIVGNIQNCCRGRFKTSYNFVWRFITEDGKAIPPEDAPQAQCSNKSTPIQALDINTGEVVRTFESKGEAMRWLRGEGKTGNTKTSNLIKSIKHNKPAYGYLWKELQG